MILYALALVTQTEFLSHYFYLKKRDLLVERHFAFCGLAYLFFNLSLQYGCIFVAVTVKTKSTKQKKVA